MRRKIARTVGLLLAAAGVFFMLRSGWTLIVQLGQSDWIETTATVVETRERRVSVSVRHGGGKMVFDADYEYTVDGERYRGTIAGLARYKAVGEPVQIKYRPDRPDECTEFLRPLYGTFAANLLFGSLYVLLALAVTGILRDLRDRAERKKAARQDNKR